MMKRPFEKKEEEEDEENQKKGTQKMVTRVTRSSVLFAREMVKSQQSSSTRERVHFGCGGGTSCYCCCQVDECEKDLSEAKRYYKRHRVCEQHAKAAVVLFKGTFQRFCQQCSKFHALSEFDDERRSCRERLASHNKRRRLRNAVQELRAQGGGGTKLIADNTLKLGIKM